MLRYTFLALFLTFAAISKAQKADDSGISAGFFDSSEERDIYFSKFKLPPLAVLFENAKSNPRILLYAKAQEIAEAEVAKQKRHIFSYFYGNASYSYGKTDQWVSGSSTYTPLITLQQYNGSTQNYWNLGVHVNVPLEDILDLGPAVRRKRLEVDRAQIEKDQAYDELKLEIATLYVKITNNLIALKTAGENAAIYQGASSLNEVEFHQGNMEIEDFAYTGQRGQGSVSAYQQLLTTITIDIITLEIMTHTPIITNTTTEVTLDEEVEKSEKQIARENKAVEKRIRQAAEEEERLKEKEEKAERDQLKKEEKEAKRAAKKKK